MQPLYLARLFPESCSMSVAQSTNGPEGRTWLSINCLAFATGSADDRSCGAVGVSPRSKTAWADSQAEET